MSKTKQRPNTGPGEEHKRICFTNVLSLSQEEDEYHLTSPYHDRVIVVQPQALKKKLLILNNILNECREEKKRLKAGSRCEWNAPLLETLTRFTSLPKDELTKINETVITRDRSFEKALKDVKTIVWPTSGFLSNDIRGILFMFIVEKKCFPSKVDVLKELKATASNYTNEIVRIHRLIKNKLIKYQHFPEFNRYLLMEHPKVVYQRTVYLKKIQEYRAQGKRFAYVTVRRIVSRNSISSFIAGLAAVPHTNKFEKFFTKGTADMMAKKWLQQVVLSLIPNDTVVVLSQPKPCHTVTIEAQRANMETWLEDHGIPFTQNAHTAVLYHLYKRFRNKVRQTQIYDHLFLNQGLEIVHCPEEWSNINFFQDIWKEIGVMDAFYTSRPEPLKQQILAATEKFKELKTVEANLIENECKMQAEDSKMEEILENVQEMIKAGEVQVHDFPKECCADTTDRFETHVGDIVFDTAHYYA